MKELIIKHKITGYLSNNKEKIVICCVAIISLFALFYPGFIYTHDGIIHLYRSAGMYENIKNFDFFNRIYYNCIDGLGYGWGIFYPPLSAFIPAIFMCLGFSVLTAEKLYIVVATILAGLFSYKLFKELYKDNFCAMITSIIYILAPYKVSQAIIRGAMGEVLVFTALPLVFLGLIKILNGESKYKYYFIFGMLAIVYSHIISIVYTTIFGALFIVLNWKKIFSKQVIKDLVISSIAILIISLPILVPVVQHQMSDRYIISGIETDVADRVVHPGQLISSSIEGKDAENTPYFSDDKEMNYMVGPCFIIILLLTPFFYKKIKENNKGKTAIWVFVVLLVISLFMMIYKGIWNRSNILDVIQYPWRILLYSVLFATILCGYVIKEMLSKDNKYIVFFVIVSFSFLFAFFIGNKVKFAKNLNNDFNFYNQELSQNDDYGSLSFSLGYAHEYLPKNMSTDIIINKQKKVDIIDGACDIENTSFDKNIFIAELMNNDEHTVVELPLIFYEGYEIKIENLDNGKESNISYEISDNGFIKINVTDIGHMRIKAKYKGTMLYRIIDILAIITFGGVIASIIINNRRRVATDER